MIADCHETRPLDHTHYTRQGPRLSRVRKPLKKKRKKRKKTHLAELQFQGMNICSAESATNIK